MTTRTDVIDAGRFSVHNNGSVAPLYWGIWGLMLVEAMVFATLLSTYLYLRSVSPAWPPVGVKPPELLLPTLNTVVLLASSGAMVYADRGIRHGDQVRLKVGAGIAIVLALAFIALKFVEYGDKPYRWDSHAYGSIVWITIGFHTSHVIALVLKTMVVEVLALRHYFNEERNLGAQVNGLYWNFVVLVWLPIYAVLYWVPRIGG